MSENNKITPTGRKASNIIQAVVVVIADCLVFGIMQGVHDYYTIM